MLQFRQSSYINCRPGAMFTQSFFHCFSAPFSNVWNDWWKREVIFQLSEDMLQISVWTESRENKSLNPFNTGACLLSWLWTQVVQWWERRGLRPCSWVSNAGRGPSSGVRRGRQNCGGTAVEYGERSKTVGAQQWSTGREAKLWGPSSGVRGGKQNWGGGKRSPQHNHNNMTPVWLPQPDAATLGLCEYHIATVGERVSSANTMTTWLTKAALLDEAARPKQFRWDFKWSILLVSRYAAGWKQ